MDLVDEKNSTRAPAPFFAGLGDGLAQFLYPREHSRKLGKPSSGGSCKKSSKCRFPRPGSSPENQRGQGPAPFDQPTDEPAFAEELFLADKLFQASRTHSLSQRRVAAGGLVVGTVKVEQAHRVVAGHGMVLEPPAAWKVATWSTECVYRLYKMIEPHDMVCGL